MELYDEEIEQKKSKAPRIIGISIVILLLLTILVILGIVYIRGSMTIIQIDGIRKSGIDKMLYVEENEAGKKIYIPIIKIAKFLGYEGFIGDYKDKSEDNTKGHIKCEDEIVMFSKDSDTLIKITNNKETQYVKLDEPVFEKNGELYTTTEGIEKAFNVTISHDEKIKKIQIYTMDFWVQHFAKTLKIKDYSEEFVDKKAILQSMMIIKQNEQYGVINVKTGNIILETKYDEIQYLPETSDFLVKSNGKYGIMNKEQSIIVKTVYDQIVKIDNEKGLYLVKQNNAYGILNAVGEVIIEPEYKQIGIGSNKYRSKWYRKSIYFIR